MSVDKSVDKDEGVCIYSVILLSNKLNTFVSVLVRWINLGPVIQNEDFPGCSAESACSARNASWIPGSERSPGKGIGYPLQYSWASLMAQVVKNPGPPPAVWEKWIQSLGWKDPLEEGMATLQYSCLENPHGQRSLAGYSPWGCKESDTIE